MQKLSLHSFIKRRFSVPGSLNELTIKTFRKIRGGLGIKLAYHKTKFVIDDFTDLSLLKIRLTLAGLSLWLCLHKLLYHKT